MAELQKISWENYKAEIELMCIRTRSTKKELLKQARNASWWSTAIGYPSKILLAVSAGGGGIQLFGENDDDLWITITRTVLELCVLIIVTTKDSFNFERKAEKYYTAAKAINAFYEIIKFQSYQIRGTEGDRLEVLKGLKEMYAEIITNNQIIQTVESISSPPTPYQMESATSSTEEDDEMMTASNSRKMSKIVPDLETQQKLSKDAVNERNRMFYLHKIIEGI